MRISLLTGIFLLASSASFAELPPASELAVNIPLMKRVGLHRVYSDSLLKLALELSKEKYGPYKIVQHDHETVIKRQLLELEKGTRLSVATSMPMPEWMKKTELVQFPIMKGLASYRLFLTLSKHQSTIANTKTLNALKRLRIGQGKGWSTGKILEDNEFQVVYSSSYASLFSMLNLGRFELLMRGVYEVEPEYLRFKPQNPELRISESIAIYTYLPMYFFVTRTQPTLAKRLRYGLLVAHKSGKHQELFYQYFRKPLKLLNLNQRMIFQIPNTNIDPSFFNADRPYLLQSIQEINNNK